jgi:hypothetical protein
MTPFKNLWKPFSVILWGNIYSSKCFNEAELDEFIASNYRRAFEDWPPDGAYRYLWTDIASNAESCDPLPPREDSTIVKALGVSYATADAVEDLAAQVAMLQEELAAMKSGSPRSNFIATIFAAMLGATMMILA